MLALRKPAACPVCNSASIVQIVWGLPGPEARSLIEKGEAISGGCMVSPGRPDWECKVCEERWFDAEDPARRELDELERRILAKHRARGVGRALLEVQEVLWYQWDPIGVNDSIEARSEYDGYAGHLVSMITNGSSDADVAEHLARIETDSMGLNGSPLEVRLAIAVAIRAAVGRAFAT